MNTCKACLNRRQEALNACITRSKFEMSLRARRLIRDVARCHCADSNVKVGTFMSHRMSRDKPEPARRLPRQRIDQEVDIRRHKNFQQLLGNNQKT